MASVLPAEQRVSYSTIIDQILDVSDLNTISAKRIRKALQDRVGYDLTPQKNAITELIMERFDRVQQRQTQAADTASERPATHVAEPIAKAADPVDSKPRPPAPTPAATTVTTNGLALPSMPIATGTTVAPKRKASSEEYDGTGGDLAGTPEPKKVKKAARVGGGGGGVESDEVIAARLQAELNQTARATRGGGVTKKKAPAKKVAKKKSAARVRDEDDSSVESGAERGEKPERPKTGGFHKPMELSAPLQALLGESVLSRPQTVKKIWAYVKERDLQDPKDKRQIMCDEPMRAVFKSDKIHMFTMNKVLATQLYPVEGAE